MFKAIRRITALVTLLVVAFRGVLTFLSWVDKQDETQVDAWIDEEESEDA